MLGPHNDILHSGRPTQKNITRRNNTVRNIEQDAFEVTGFSAKIGQKHTLHYPIIRNPQMQHSPEPIIKELGLEQVFGYEQQPLGNSQSGNFTWDKESRARNSVPTCPIHNVKVILEDEKLLGLNQDKAPEVDTLVFTHDLPLPLGSIEPTPQEADIGGHVTHKRTGITPVLKLSDTDSKNRHSSVEETYFLTSKGNLNYTSERGNGSDNIEEDLECNEQQANKDDVVGKGTKGYAVSHELPLNVSDFELTQLIIEELEQEWQKNRIDNESDCQDAPKVYSLHSNTKTPDLEHKGWTLQYVVQVWRKHPLRPPEVSNKNKHLSPPNQDTPYCKGMLFDCKHCGNSCIGVAYRREKENKLQEIRTARNL